jgi:hypothetical protein
MLSQAFYWSKNKRAEERGGWFYKSHVEWEEETGLTRREQQTARMHLRAKGLIEEQDGSLKGKGRVLWFRVNRDALLDGLKRLVESESGATAAASAEPADMGLSVGEPAQGVAPKRPTPEHESARPVAPNRSIPLITSENTSETTTEKTHTRLRAVGAPAGGVGVSVFSRKFREGYAAHFKLFEGWLRNSGCGTYDSDILAAVRRHNLFAQAATWGTDADATLFTDSAPRSAEEAHPVGDSPRSLVSFEQAAGCIAQLAALPGYDVAGYIAQMQNISEETRTKLREKFLNAPAAKAQTA